VTVAADSEKATAGCWQPDDWAGSGSPLGKIERFWGSLWRERVETAVFMDLGDARTRIGHFIDHYNFQRPHQGLDGLGCPWMVNFYQTDRNMVQAPAGDFSGPFSQHPRRQ